MRISSSIVCVFFAFLIARQCAAQSVGTYNPISGSCTNSDTSSCQKFTASDNFHGTVKCNSGQCVAKCDAGYHSCDAGSYCNVFVNTSLAHCGACHRDCSQTFTATFPGVATLECDNGDCRIATCKPQHTACYGRVYPYKLSICPDLDTDPNNCGQCWVTALSTFDPSITINATCINAFPTVTQCVDNYTPCTVPGVSSACVDFNNDTMNCGACGQACTTGQNHVTGAACMTGQCEVTSCDTNYQDCNIAYSDGCESDSQTDSNNCGMCGTQCSAYEGTASCANGMCQIDSCTQPYADCDSQYGNGCESNLMTDNSNCGTCGAPCALHGNALSATCTNGLCVITCPTGFADCNGASTDGCEVNLNTDSNNCGACASMCTADASMEVSTVMCSAGMCAVDQCVSGFANCDGMYANGCEINTNTDSSNCGSCTTVCSAFEGMASCHAGSCMIDSCTAPYADCDMTYGDGCESNLMSDNANCGACNMPCAPHGNALSASCTNGVCVSVCPTGFADCNGDAADGCEVNLNLDASHCGSCATVCTPSAAIDVMAVSCSSGMCAIAACIPGFADCDGMYNNGCEVNTNTDTANCGQCNTLCAAADATVACSSGHCMIAQCDANFADCDTQYGDGCEVDLTSNKYHCGSCGLDCTSMKMGQQVFSVGCASSACMIAQCLPGFSDCNQAFADGCEIHTANDEMNCGACGAMCYGNKPNVAKSTCTMGMCSLICATGYRDCDANPLTGCETQTATDINNCGACGNKCNVPNGHATTSCSGGKCKIASCDAGYADCDKDPSNGCEQHIAGDLNNCGGCGIKCGSPSHAVVTCSTTSTPNKCMITSCDDPNYLDCDTTYANGCEYHYNSTQKGSTTPLYGNKGVATKFSEAATAQTKTSTHYRKFPPYSIEFIPSNTVPEYLEFYCTDGTNCIKQSSPGAGDVVQFWLSGGHTHQGQSLTFEFYTTSGTIASVTPLGPGDFQANTWAHVSVTIPTGSFAGVRFINTIANQKPLYIDQVQIASGPHCPPHA